LDVKKRDLEKQLRAMGWYFKRHGGCHDYWTNGEIHESVPRHNEVKEHLARAILRVARENPPKK
jgi:mRNA interferase HicA